MIKLTISGNVPHGQKCDVFIDGQRETINGAIPAVTYEFEQEGTYEVKFIIKTPPVSKSFLEAVLFAITLPIRGLFSVLLMYVDNDWYSSIRPYAVEARFSLELLINADIQFSCTESEFDAKDKNWSLPILNIYPEVAPEISYSLNNEDFMFQYSRFAKNFISVASVAICLFAYLLYISIKQDIIIGTIICGFLVLCIFVLLPILLTIQKNKMTKLLSSFEIKEGI